MKEEHTCNSNENNDKDDDDDDDDRVAFTITGKSFHKSGCHHSARPKHPEG